MYTMIIADDEAITRKSMELFIKKEFPDIEITASCENGVELVRMCEELEPDMAIVDINMPGITGVGAIEMLKSKHLRTRFIIHTAYDEFEYVKKALDMKVDAYLLKPQKYEESKRSIQKVCDAIWKEKEEHERKFHMQSLIHAVSPVLENEIMLSIYTNKPNTEGFETFCKVNEITCRGGFVMTMVNGEDADLAEDLLRSSAADALSGVCDYLFAVHHTNILLLLLVPLHVRKEEEDGWTEDISKIIFETMKQRTGISYRIGYGKVYDSFAQMPLSYQDSAQMLKAGRRWNETETAEPEKEESGAACGQSGKKVSVYVERAVGYIDKNYQRDISLDNVAAYADISPYYLSHLMKQEINRSFVEYLTDVRMKQAMRLAGETALPIKTIAEKCGYSNETYFCKVFKAQVGKTIGVYRRNLRFEQKENREE